MRTKAERIKNDYKHIARKEYILKHVYPEEAFNGFAKNGQRNRLSKGKVHCSCPLCSAKTKYNGRKHSEELKIESMNEKEKEFNSRQYE